MPRGSEASRSLPPSEYFRVPPGVEHRIFHLSISPKSATYVVMVRSTSPLLCPAPKAAAFNAFWCYLKKREFGSSTNFGNRLGPPALGLLFCLSTRFVLTGAQRRGDEASTPPRKPTPLNNTIALESFQRPRDFNCLLLLLWTCPVVLLCVCFFSKSISKRFFFGVRENTREKSEIHIFCASAVKRLQDQDAQLPQVW